MTRKANRHGQILEDTIRQVFVQRQFQVLPHREWKKVPVGWQGDVLVEHVPFETIYGHRGRTEFLALSPKRNLEVRIECKWQQVSGSVDEKLPYLYLNAVQAMPEKVIVLVVDGPGWKKGAVEWLRCAAKNHLYDTQEKKIFVFNLSEFLAWSNDLF